MIGGELDGRYRILSKVGEGAMGEVYLVEHLALGRKEALKVLRSSMDTPSLVTRFRREARATNRLQHPNIVAIHDFGVPSERAARQRPRGWRSRLVRRPPDARPVRGSARRCCRHYADRATVR